MIVIFYFSTLLFTVLYQNTLWVIQLHGSGTLMEIESSDPKTMAACMS